MLSVYLNIQIYKYALDKLSCYNVVLVLFLENHVKIFRINLLFMNKTVKMILIANYKKFKERRIIYNIIFDVL